MANSSLRCAAGDLVRLAEAHGIQSRYVDGLGVAREASEASLVGVLRALGVAAEGEHEIRDSLAARAEQVAARWVEPVVVAWDGAAPEIDVRFPAGADRFSCHSDLESGERRGRDLSVSELTPGREAGTYRLPIGPLPLGYHRVSVAIEKKRAEVLVISAPRRGHPLPPHLWGAFLPLYALRTKANWGTGDLGDLGELSRWIGSFGGGVVATLPLLATFLDRPFEPSPYAPASRLFWNEAILDVPHLPEWQATPTARRLAESIAFEAEVAALTSRPTVDWVRVAALKRWVVGELARTFFHREGARREAFERYAEAHPHLEHYAAFRAVGDRRGDTWQAWPERMKNGTLLPSDYDEDSRRYHLFVQWALADQLGNLARDARRTGPGLYLDLPLGVHASAFDVWRERSIFATGASAGAPPDALFQKGQSWGFPPHHPERLRESGYAYLIASLRHHMRVAGILRLDHVMQLHRLYWVPDGPNGSDATDGAYVTYPADELYAILCLESHRHRTALVGENLGTVPPEVYERLEGHGMLGLYVAQYEFRPEQDEILREPPEAVAASLNTHDMPPFAAFWDGSDLDDLQALGALDAEEAAELLLARARLRARVAELVEAGVDLHAARELALDALHEGLARSRARLVLVNLEDLWGEHAPQNVPGTHIERPNWRRKASLTLEEMKADEKIAERLRRIDRARRGVDA